MVSVDLVQFALRPSAFCTRLSEGASRIIVAHLVGDFSRKRIEPDMIAGPTRALEGRTFPAAGGAACTGTQFVA
jgi:hypothetical protein